MKTVLQEVYKQYTSDLINGTRSSSKVEPIHKYVGSFLANPRYEAKIDGLVYSKNVDIIDDITNIIYEIKLIMSNFSQNSNNYLESLMGATSNLQNNGYKVCQIIFIPTYMPYYKNNKTIKKIEYVSVHHIQKYMNLITTNDKSNPHKLIFVLYSTGNEEFLRNNIDNTVTNKDLFESYNIEIIKEFNYNDNNINEFLRNNSNLEKILKELNATI